MSDEDDVTNAVAPTEDVDVDHTADADNRSDDEKPRRRALGRARVEALLLTLGLIAAGALAGWIYFTQYRPDVQTDRAVSQSAVDAARDGTVALLSYKPDTLTQDFDSAKSRLSGDFLKFYEQFTAQVITPAARDRGVATTAQVVGAAPVELHPGSAVVLVFVNQVTVSKEQPDPATASTSVLVSLSQQDGRWSINKFDPV